MTVAEGQIGDAGAVFDFAPKVGSVSDKRAAVRRGEGLRKKGAVNNTLNEVGRRELAWSGDTPEMERRGVSVEACWGVG